ncbi:MAG TPA: hypothetical protein PKW18_00535 [Candidatus Sumerlaeota bacterium]|nr:hypothetical protein [Candidatus Sumerlaeota bacterium]HRR30944.1 hypothetical protein [Candidatus Sumerlaeia bacterium]HON49364.1 hypothetical protein [Candidatus Sumerlaeota bacterium]HOR64888.1 hypothetical protein [Candidatus Sumerlaeota bacterium]HPL73041.1 hypothetical protein [Candidatus Sumerlaeota bacterium]
MLTEIKNETALKKNSILRDRVFLLILFLGIIFKIAFIMYVPDAPEDAFNYVNYADKAIRDGYWGHSFFGREAHFLFTFLLYILALIFRSGYLGGKILSLASTTITIVLVYDIAIKRISRRCGLYAAALLSFTSLGWLTNALAVLSEPLFMCLSVLTMWLYVEKKPSWLIAIVIAVSLWVRLEAGFFYPVIFLFYASTRKWRDMVILTVIGTISVAARYILIPSGTMGWASKVLSERFGKNYGMAELGAILLKNINLLVYQLGADSAYLCWMYKIIFGIGFVLCLCFRQKSRDIFFFKVLFVLAINVLGLSIMKYKRVHPSAERHYVYLAPFFAILIGASFDGIENFFGSAAARFEKKSIIRFLGYMRIPVYCACIVLFFLLGAFSNRNSWRLQTRYGFLWKHVHFHDMHKIAGKWIQEHIKPGEGIIFSLPTDQHYSKIKEKNSIYVWSADRLDYNYYIKNNIRYVVWSDIQSDYYRIRALGRDRDFLFFKFRLAPDNGHHWYGWRSVIYEIDHDFGANSPIAIGCGNGFLPRESGKYLMNTVAHLNVFSEKRQRVKIFFQAEALDAPRTLLVKQRGIKLGEFSLPMRMGAELDNATSGTFWMQSEGEGVATILLESPEPIAASFKTDRKDDNPFVIFMGDVRVEESEPPHLVQVHGEGWYAPETWGRWIKDKASMEIHTKGAGQVLLRANVKSYKIDRTLQVNLNGVKVGEYFIGKDYSFDNNNLTIELMLETKDGANILEFIAEPGARASKSFEETRRNLTIAFNDFILVRLR